MNNKRWKLKAARIIGETAFKNGLSVRWSGETCHLEKRGVELTGELKGRRVELSYPNRGLGLTRLWELDYRIMDAFQKIQVGNQP